MSNQVNRRNFLRLSATAGAALALAPAGIQAKGTGVSQTKMPERTLGTRTGIKVPVLGMGVMRADNPAIVRAAYNSGIILYDTANSYQNGKNEEMLGEFFADKPRDSFIMTSRAREAPSDTAAANFLEQFETSIKRLKLSYLDVFSVHGMTSAEQVNYAPILEVLMKLKKDGRIKYTGFSTHSNMPEVINAAVDNGNYDVIVTSYNYTLQDITELNAAIDRAVKAGIGIVAMKSMAGGFLDRERTQKVNTRAALKWVLQNPNIHTAIPGFSSFDELEESIDTVMNPELTNEERNYLSAASPSMYCQGCRICEGQCLKGLPIPEMMRAYMYNYGYKSPALAKEVINELALTENPCGGCTNCSVKCISGFQVAQKIQDITRLCHVPQEFLA